MHLLANVPHQIVDIPHWVAWREEPRADGKMTKVPYQATDSMLRASPTNPETWNNLRSAVRKALLINQVGLKSGTGFVLTQELGMVCIDLDDPYKLGDNARNALTVHEQILEAFEGTYKEVSPSGDGYHIWLYGTLPQGRSSLTLKDKAGIEIYSSKRYMTMTGRQYGMCEELTNQQAMLDRLVALMTNINGGTLPGEAVGNADLEDSYDLGRVGHLSDSEVVQTAIRNNSKFLEFFNATPPSDRSRFAKPVAGDLDKVSSSPEQILRIMLASPIGRCYQPAELERKLFTYWLPESRVSNQEILEKREEGRAMQRNMIAAEERRQAEADAMPEKKPVISSDETFRPPFRNGPGVVTPYAQDYPPGMIGILAREIRERATMRASMDFAIAAALGLFAGLSGHAYTFEKVNGAIYMLMLGSSGQGKEAPAEARDVMVKQLIQAGVAPAILTGMHGPQKITSPQGLHRRLETDKTLLMILGESTIWLNDLVTSKNNMWNEIQRFILDLYGKQSIGREISPAETIGKDNKLGSIMSPAATILMEGEPSRYMELLGNDAYTTSGLCARIVHVFGAPDDMPAKQYSRPSFSEHTVQQLAGVVEHWHNKKLMQIQYQSMGASGHHGGGAGGIRLDDTYIHVTMTPDCEEFHRGFDREMDYFGRDNVGRVNDIYNRVVPNLLRVAVNIAAGINPYAPVIDMQVYLWAQAFVMRGLSHLIQRFENGAVGTGDNRVREIIVEQITKWSEMLPAERERRLLTSGQIRGDDRRKLLSKLKGIPVSMLQRQTATRISRHVNAERATVIMKTMLRDLIDTGEIVVAPGVSDAGVSFSGQLVFKADDADDYNGTQ